MYNVLFIKFTMKAGFQKAVIINESAEKVCLPLKTLLNWQTF